MSTVFAIFSSHGYFVSLLRINSLDFYYLLKCGYKILLVFFRQGTSISIQGVKLLAFRLSGTPKNMCAEFEVCMSNGLASRVLTNRRTHTHRTEKMTFSANGGGRSNNFMYFRTLSIPFDMHFVKLQTNTRL